VPQYGGKDCSLDGPEIITQACSPQSCPGKMPVVESKSTIINSLLLASYIVPIQALATQPIIVEIVRTSISKIGGARSKKFPAQQKLLNEKLCKGSL